MWIKRLLSFKLETGTRFYMDVGFDFKDEADYYRFRGFVVAFAPDVVREWREDHVELEARLSIYLCCFFVRFRWDAGSISCIPHAIVPSRRDS